METFALVAALAIAGVNFGWQQADDGTGVEYIVQVEPELVDVMNRGHEVPIESTVPPEVGPIRKVRIVVGRGDVPREPVRHTANFAGEAGWSPDRYNSAAPVAGSNYDRYTAPTTSGTSGVGPPPSVLDRTQNALSETGSAISNGAQAGAQSVSDQFSQTGSQLMDGARNATQNAGQTMQQWSDDASRRIQTSVSPTSSRSAVSEPPWPAASAATTPVGGPVDYTAAPGMAVTRTTTGWTSIGTNVAAPPLLTPPLPTTNSSGIRTAAAGGNGPLLAPPSTANNEPIHSVLVDPSRQSAAAGTGSDWSGSNWSGSNSQAQQATIGRGTESTRTDPAMVPVRPVSPGQQTARQPADRWSDPWAESDPWRQNAPPANTQQMAGNSGNAAPAPVTSGWPAPSPTTTQLANNPPLIGTNSNNVLGPTGAGTLPASTNPNGQLAAAGAAPWMPWVLVCLALIGSLSANFFLGWSYMDARLKYHTLVQKTASTFRRAAAAAAA